MQAKRIQINTGSDTAGQQNEVSLTSPTDPREQVNFHNIWASAGATPVNADANADGWWVLYLRRAGETFLDLSEALLNSEVENQRIIACGQWQASNQHPWNMEPMQLKTSRNLNPGERIQLGFRIRAVSGGAVSSTLMLCAHTVRK